MFLGSLRRRAGWKAAIAADAHRLMESFHEHAYFEARDRVRGRCIDGVHPARYWIAVKLEIARRQGIAIGLAGADMRGYPVAGKQQMPAASARSRTIA